MGYETKLTLKDLVGQDPESTDPEGYEGRLPIKQLMAQELLVGESKQNVVKYMVVNGRGQSDWPVEVYVAWRRAPDSVTCLVVLVSYDKDHTYVRVIDEDMGPVMTQCPPQVLQCLTPAESTTAMHWRSACSRYVAWRKSVETRWDRMVVGDVVFFSEPYLGNKAAIYSGKGTSDHRALFSALNAAFVNDKLHGAKARATMIISDVAARDVKYTSLKVGSRVRLSAQYADMGKKPMSGVLMSVVQDRPVPYAVVHLDLSPNAYMHMSVPLCALEPVQRCTPEEEMDA